MAGLVTEAVKSDVPVIAIDGPGGSGKGTVSRQVAGRLGWHFLDSGALYRLVGLAAEWHGIALDDETAVGGIAANLDVRFAAGSGGSLTQIFLEGDEVTEAIRSEACGSAASQVAALPAVRTALLGRQRAFRRPPGLVADGRDMGTVVFPDAVLKIFLTASAAERANRRYKQLKDKGMDVSLGALRAEIEHRDRRDSERLTAPMRPAEDAVVVDTTAMSVDEVVERVVVLWRNRNE
jgi:cytidylate kinase